MHRSGSSSSRVHIQIMWHEIVFQTPWHHHDGQGIDSLLHVRRKRGRVSYVARRMSRQLPRGQNFAQSVPNHDPARNLLLQLKADLLEGLVTPNAEVGGWCCVVFAAVLVIVLAAVIPVVRVLDNGPFASCSRAFIIRVIILVQTGFPERLVIPGDQDDSSNTFSHKFATNRHVEFLQDGRFAGSLVFLALGMTIAATAAFAGARIWITRSRICRIRRIGTIAHVDNGTS